MTQHTEEDSVRCTIRRQAHMNIGTIHSSGANVRQYHCINKKNRITLMNILKYQKFVVLHVTSIKQLSPSRQAWKKWKKMSKQIYTNVSGIQGVPRACDPLSARQTKSR